MTISTSCPQVRSLRTTIERYILDLYEADGTTLKAEASWPGYYTLPNTTRIPAVYVVGEAMVPSDWVVTGIECTITDVPEISSPGSVGAILSFERWPVRFTNYGTRKGTRMPTTLLDISRRLARTLPRDSATYTPRTEATYEALTVSITGAVLNPPIP
jgi:hypothetical protein